MVGTEEYIAPETLSEIEVSYGCDLWSLGVIIYQLFTGYTPFKGDTLLETYNNITDREDIPFKNTGIEETAQDLI